MENLLIRKLERYTRLSRDDCEALNVAATQRVRRRDARRDIIREGEKPDNVNLILSGWACRYKVLSDGRRQILAFFLPGDLCDLHVYILREMDHSISAITPITYAEINRSEFERMTTDRPRLMQAMWWDTLVTAAIQREWTTDIGQRSSLERLAHLLAELFHRLHGVGLATANSCELPLTQAEIAEAMGMTSVHANRMLQELRAMNLIELKNKRLMIQDLTALEELAQFHPRYLHLEREGSALNAND